jgi:epoxyqueuosine reductase
MAAVRAGTGTLGKNCLLFSNNAVRRSSWILPVAIVIDREIEPDNPTYGVGCPDWCRNACVAACPTRALSGSGSMDPRKCISFLSYFGDGITPAELREPMGMYVYGCDICQNVCPRNTPWLSQALPVNKRVQSIEKDFDLSVLLHMDKNHFESRVWPRMFYMGYNDIWRWKMNVARVMGNSLDPKYVPDLERAFDENNDERVRGMIAWALGRIGGKAARRVLEKMTIPAETVVKTEIDNAMERISS